MTQRGILIVALLCLPALTLLLGALDASESTRGGQGQPKTQDRKTPKLERAGSFVREVGTCRDCHEDETARIEGGLHAGVPASLLLDRCETCHGPGALHADENEAMQITHPAKLPLAEQKALCGHCHAAQIGGHASLDDFEVAKKACSDCHKVHEVLSDVPGHGDERSFSTKAALDAAASPVGAERCASCHATKAESLEGRTHASLGASVAADSSAHALLERAKNTPWHGSMSCEACHGAGSLHAAHGSRRFITRPDLAVDGDQACLACHDDVDPERFHWKNDVKPPFLSPAERLRCTTCHVVHRDGDPTLAARDLVETASGDASAENRSCYACHAEAFGPAHIGGTTHSELARLDLPPGQGCVACHSGAAEDARSGGADGLVSLRDVNAATVAQACNACHGGDRSVCGFSLGAHGRAKTSCIDCHSPGSGLSKRDRVLDANKNCANCHAATALDFQHVNRHPIGEGTFHCSSCHDPHHPVETGPSSARRMARTCVDCHKEFRGPFVFPHHADKALGCMACHKPHGSPNRKLLDQVRARDNCLQCHADLPAFHDMSPGSRYQNCLDCHVKVHGSNRNRFFFR